MVSTVAAVQHTAAVRIQLRNQRQRIPVLERAQNERNRPSRQEIASACTYHEQAPVRSCHSYDPLQNFNLRRPPANAVLKEPSVVTHKNERGVEAGEGSPCAAEAGASSSAPVSRNRTPTWKSSRSLGKLGGLSPAADNVVVRPAGLFIHRYGAAIPLDQTPGYFQLCMLTAFVSQTSPVTSYLYKESRVPTKASPHKWGQRGCGVMRQGHDLILDKILFSSK